MKDSKDWDERYTRRDLPWDTGRQDKRLEEFVPELCGGSGRVLELGCGTGSNAIWLARQGLQVTAVDISPVAIMQATAKATRAGVRIDLAAADVLRDPIPNAPFGFVFDRGCFHSFDSPQDRSACARVVHRLLAPASAWFSLIGSADGPQRETGPPRLTVAEIAAAVEPFFEILQIRTTHFDSDRPDPPRAWACVMRRRAGED